MEIILDRFNATYEPDEIISGKINITSTKSNYEVSNI